MRLIRGASDRAVKLIVRIGRPAPFANKDVPTLLVFSIGDNFQIWRRGRIGSAERLGRHVKSDAGAQRAIAKI